MASTLTKLLSRLCLNKEVGFSNALKLSRNVVSKEMRIPSNRCYSLLQSQRQSFLPGFSKNCEQERILQCPTALSIAKRPVTYEIKQWREHRVINRFYRLHWGGWIRTRGGKNRRLYRKSPQVRWKLQQHIFCNKTQNQRLDRLVLPHWREPKYFVDSPYEIYHKRTNFQDFPNHRKFYP